MLTVFMSDSWAAAMKMKISLFSAALSYTVLKSVPRTGMPEDYKHVIRSCVVAQTNISEASPILLILLEKDNLLVICGKEKC